MNPSFSISNSSIVVVFPDLGKPLTISSSYKAQYQQAINHIKNKSWAQLRQVCDIVGSIKQYTDKVIFKNGICQFNGKELNNVVTKKIREFWQEGLPVEPLVKFLENCLLNPSQTAVEELYLFLEKNSFTITEDGCFVAWKAVDKNFMSFHVNPDGTHNRNKIGDVVKQDRNLCDPNRDQICAPGLHFCEFSYLSYYTSTPDNRIILVKVNPQNVTAIPSDYSNAKGRCCEYEVVAEVNVNKTGDVIKDHLLFSVDKNGVKYYSNRDSNGRFVSVQ